MASIETQTKIGILSKALILCGEKPCSSLTENRYGVTVGSNLFEQLYEAELQSNRWRFACGKIALSRLVDTPLNEWQYAYQLPATLLLPLGQYPAQPYEIYADRIYTNATSFELEYLFKPDVSACPAYFTLLLTYALYRDMVGPITELANKVTIAESMYNKQRARAQFADAQSRPNKPLVDSPFTQNR
jgi:hypothetical protein